MNRHAMIKPLTFVLSAALALSACQQPAEPPAQLVGTDIKGAPFGGPFTLTGEDGKRYAWDDFKGKYRMVYFGYAFCPDACPTDVAVMMKGFQKFEKEHGVKLGFMSFFVKAAVAALKKYPIVNASVDGNDIVYHGYFDIGIAVGSPRGLVVPILRNADQMSFADIEKKIAEFGVKARDGKLGIEEMTGGTFSISNGGVFGSMLSTPIINPPQSAILGVHATKDRAVVENGQVVVRPINYLAMSYDHRIIDGREAVLGLVAMKEALEDPARLLFDI